MGVLIRGYLVSPKFSVPLAAKLRVGATKVLVLWERTRGALSHIHRCQVWWISEFTAAGAAKNVEFLCVFVRHAFERQSLCARFRHEGVNDFDALVCSCAVYMHPYSTLSDCRQRATPQNAKVQKNGKIRVLSLPEGDRNKPIETKFGT